MDLDFFPFKSNYLNSKEINLQNRDPNFGTLPHLDTTMTMYSIQ